MQFRVPTGRVLSFCVFCLVTGTLAVFSQETVVSVPLSQPAELKIHAGTDILIHEGETLPVGIELQVQGGSRDFIYAWTTPDEQTYTDSVINSGVPGMYRVSVYDANNCSATDSLLLTLITGISGDLTTNKILNCYPNPSTGILYYEILNTKGNPTLSVITQSGSVVIEKKLTGTGPVTGYIDMKHLPGGMYFLRLKDQGNIYIRQIILK